MKIDAFDSWFPINAAETTLVVLVSGGLDSAVLLGQAATRFRSVQPIYVRVGSIWETVELAYLQRFLTCLNSERVQPLRILAQPVEDIYENGHWSLSGNDVPDAASADEAVFLPGRNVLLLTKALIWCVLQKIPFLAMAPLAANPFPDATPEFFSDFGRIVGNAVGRAVKILTPYTRLHKPDVIRIGRAMPLQYTFSCIQPIDGVHCGHCNKCAERHLAFTTAEVPDPTIYWKPAWTVK